METLARSQDDTENFAALLAGECAPGTVILLTGGLGAGKTVFARALIRTLANNPALEVPSPTFTLVQTYETPRGEIWHFDLYRLDEPDEIFELGWEEALNDKIVLVEWPERLGPYAPAKARHIDIRIDDDGSRRIGAA